MRAVCCPMANKQPITQTETEAGNLIRDEYIGIGLMWSRVRISARARAFAADTLNHVLRADWSDCGRRFAPLNRAPLPWWREKHPSLRCKGLHNSAICDFSNVAKCAHDNGLAM